MKFKVGDYAQLKAGYWGIITKIVKPKGGYWSASGLERMHAITIRFIVKPNPIYIKEEESFYEDSFMSFRECFDANDILKGML